LIWSNFGFKNWRFGISWHNRKHFGLDRWNDVTQLTLGVFMIGRLTGKDCHGNVKLDF